MTKYILVNYDVGYFKISFVRVISMSLRLAAKLWLHLDVDYGIGLVEVLKYVKQTTLQ